MDNFAVIRRLVLQGSSLGGIFAKVILLLFPAGGEFVSPSLE